MVLESTIICVDNSDYMRNGDFLPNRMAAMQDAVNMVCHAKTRSNPENNVGLLTLVGNEVLTTLTTDVNKLMSKLLALQPQGSLHLMSALRVAHLALKHRQGKNHKMRIVLFVGSPINSNEENELVKLAKRFKKEKVNVDIVSFGEDEANQQILSSFLETLNGKEGTGSHLMVVSRGPSLTDALVASPILESENGAPMGGMSGGGFEFGVDPNDDPDLALALRVSMEEQRARQEAEARANNPDAGADATNEEKMLEKALAMSMDTTTSGAGPSSTPAKPAEPDFSQMSEEEQIAYAMQMSLQDTGHEMDVDPKDPKDAQVKKEAPETKPDISSKGKAETMEVEESTELSKDMKTVLSDSKYLQQVLEDVPGGSSEVKEETLQAAKNVAENASKSSTSSDGGKNKGKNDPKSPKKK